jgi:hypothetical protein
MQRLREQNNLSFQNKSNNHFKCKNLVDQSSFNMCKWTTDPQRYKYLRLKERQRGVASRMRVMWYYSIDS